MSISLLQTDDGLPAAESGHSRTGDHRVPRPCARTRRRSRAGPERTAIGDDAASDADLAVDDEDVATVGISGRGLRDGGEVGLVGHATRYVGSPSLVATGSRARHALPSQVGCDRDRAGVVVDQAGDPGDDRHRHGARAATSASGAVEQVDQAVDHLAGTQAPGVDGRAALADSSPGEVDGEGGHVVDVDLGTDAARSRCRRSRRSCRDGPRRRARRCRRGPARGRSARLPGWTLSPC